MARDSTLIATFTALAAVACGRASAPSTTASDLAGESSTGDCASAFEPPKGAVLLCDEHVMSTDAEIHWRSYGVVQERYTVFEPYRAIASRCGYGFGFKPPLLDVTEGGRRLELFDAADTSYPRCAKGPDTSHRTVVVVSEKLERK